MRFLKNKIIFLLTLVLLSFITCKQNNENNTRKITSVLKDKTNSSKNVVIKGFADDTKAFDYMNFINYSYFRGANHDNLFKEKINDTTIFTLESINQAQIIEVFSFGDSTNYSTRIFASPGDSIAMLIDKRGIGFNGRNASQYNFFAELDSTNTEWAKNKYKGDIKDYKKRCLSIYKRRHQFFEDYIVKNQVSNDFKRIVGAELKFEYLYNLVAPRSVTTEFGFNVNSQEGFFQTIAKDYDVERDGFFDVGDYMDHITINDFKRPELLNEDYFKRSLVAFIRSYYVNYGRLNYSTVNFKTEKEYIQNHLNGSLENYAITSLIHDYYEKGFGQGKIDREEIKNLIHEYKDKGLNPSYREALDRIDEKLDAFGLKFPEKVMAERLIGLSGDTVTLDNVLKKAKNKIKVLDLWASWCSPCISEITKTKTFRKHLANNENIEWVFISVDSHQEKWLNKSKELREFLKNEYQYRLLNTDKSSIISFLTDNRPGTFMIPRYIIIGYNDKIETISAPRPSDSLIFTNLITKIKIDNP